MKLERKATITSLSVALGLTSLKLFIWIISSSVAVLSSAVDSLLDFFVSAFNYIAVKNADKEMDKNFNYWRWKIEALATFIEGVIINISWLFILYKSVLKLINKEELQALPYSVLVMILSVSFTFFLVRYLNYVEEKTKNIVIKADKLHYKMDLYTNVWILFSLVFIYFTDFYFIDGIVWIMISSYVIYTAFGMTKEGFLLLLDVSLPEEEVEKINKILNSCDRITGYHYVRTRSSWKYKFFSVHLVFDEDIKLIDAHEVADNVELKVKQIDKSKERIINIHLDPYDDSNYCLLSSDNKNEIKVENKKLKNGFELSEVWIWTWPMWGYRDRDESNNDKRDIEAIRHAIKSWIRHIDTAEIYANWYGEILVGEAIKGFDRKGLIIASKVKWSNVSKKAIKRACKNSLERIGIDYLDLYYIHRRDKRFDLKESMEAMDELVDEWLIKNIWVSNFCKDSLKEAQSYCKHKIVANQVHYNIIFRQPEVDSLLKYCQKNDVFLVAWRPFELWKLANIWNHLILDICKKYNKSQAQVAINRLISQKNVVALFKSSDKGHIDKNLWWVWWKMKKSDIENIRENYKGQIFKSDTIPLG